MSIIREPNAEPIDGYRLIEPLGSGGFGEVWKCEAPGGFLKAIKLVYGNLDEAGEDGKAAEQEKKSLERIKQIRHPFRPGMAGTRAGQKETAMHDGPRTECQGRLRPALLRCFSPSTP